MEALLRRYYGAIKALLTAEPHASGVAGALLLATVPLDGTAAQVRAVYLPLLLQKYKY